MGAEGERAPSVEKRFSTRRTSPSNADQDPVAAAALFSGPSVGPLAADPFGRKRTREKKREVKKRPLRSMLLTDNRGVYVIKKCIISYDFVKKILDLMKCFGNDFQLENRIGFVE